MKRTSHVAESIRKFLIVAETLQNHDTATGIHRGHGARRGCLDPTYVAFEFRTPCVHLMHVPAGMLQLHLDRVCTSIDQVSEVS
jgi:hypothetical protein